MYHLVVHGSLIYTGTGVSSSVAGQLDNDIYLNTSAGDFYQLVGGVWTLEENIKGSAGATGATGAAGTNGSNSTNGSNGSNGQGVPTGGSGNQVLAKIDGTNYNTAWINQWTNSFSNLYYNVGDVGIGMSAPIYQLDVNPLAGNNTGIHLSGGSSLDDGMYLSTLYGTNYSYIGNVALQNDQFVVKGPSGVLVGFEDTGL